MNDFNVTVTFTYSASDEESDAWYQTRDPAEIAAIDQQGWSDDPIALGATIAEHDYKVAVTPAEPAA